MQVILREEVPNLGHVGDVLMVKDGYGRNYLLPRGLAVLASSRNVRRLDHDKRVISQREQKLRRKAEVVKEQMEGLSLSIAKQVGEGEKLFGSVTNREILDAIKLKGFDIDKKALRVDEPIRSLGVHQVKVKLSRDIEAEIKVWVVAAE